MVNLSEAAQTLSPDERRILQVVSVVYEPVNQTALQAILNNLAWHDMQDHPLAGLVARPLRERLLDQGFLIKKGQAFICAPELVESLTRETVRLGVFNRIAAAAELAPSLGEHERAQTNAPSAQRTLCRQ